MSKAFRNILIALTVGIVVPALAFAYFVRQHQNQRSSGCQSNLKQLALAMGQYIQDSGGTYPVAQIGWANAIQPYVRSQDFGCPSDRNPPFFLVRGPLGVYSSNSSGLYNGYWYNGNLSGVSKRALAFPQATLLLGEGNDGRDVKDVTYHKTALPANWLTDTTKPCWRHMGGANYLYTDGHIAWLKPAQVTSNFGRINCFSIK
jgi:prepilin-type processing-associated H-X9-DG protein